MQRLLTTSLAFLGLFIATTGFAQDKPKRGNLKNLPQQPAGSQAPQTTDGRKPDGPANKMGRMTALQDIIAKLDLNVDQQVEVRSIMQSYVEEMKGGMKSQLGRGKDGAAPLAEMKQEREALIARLQSQGLKGKELKQAVMQSLGNRAKPQAGERPKDAFIQKQAELISKIRDILDDEQKVLLDEALQKLAAERQANDPATRKKGKNDRQPN